MKNVVTLLGAVLISSTVFAADSQMDSFACGKQVAQSVVALSKSAAAQDAQNLSEDVENYLAQTTQAAKEKTKAKKQQVLQAAKDSWQSINYSMDQIKAASPAEAAAINKACNLMME